MTTQNSTMDSPEKPLDKNFENDNENSRPEDSDSDEQRLPGAIRMHPTGHSGSGSDDDDEEHGFDSIGAAAATGNIVSTQDPAPAVEEPANNTYIVVATVVDDDDKPALTTGSNNNKKIIYWVVAGVFLVVVIAIGVTVGLVVKSKNKSSLTSENDKEADDAFLWINNSSVEAYALSLPTYTIDVLQQDLKVDSRDGWYTNKLWSDRDFEPASSQGLAWQWLVSDPDIVKYNESDINVRFVLAALYYETNGGTSWKKNTYWLDSTRDVCEWYYSDSKNEYPNFRKDCQQNGYQHLLLAENSLSGPLPKEIGLLTSLVTMALSSPFRYDYGDTEPSLSGSMPSTIVSLANLQRLDLGYSSISGTIPEDIGKLSKLQNLILTYTQLKGTLPASMVMMTNLVELQQDLVYPDDSLLSSWKNLHTLSLWGESQVDYVVGTPSSALGLLTNLEVLELNYLWIDSTIPEAVLELSNLKKLRMARCQLKGSIPAAMSKLSNLYSLALNKNSLTGTISDQIWQSWSNVSELKLYENNFNGTISTSIGLLSNATNIDLGSNSFTGTIPSEIGMLTTLKELWLNDNSLTGTIPSSILNLNTLELEIDGNPGLV